MNPKDPQAELRDKLEKLRVIVVTDGVRRGRLADDTIDEILALIQAREQQLLTELLGELPEKRDGDVDPQTGAPVGMQGCVDHGFDIALDQVVSVIERLQNKTNDGGNYGGL